ncbi:MAG TPA: hypothetical protein VFG50_10990 [Rhodothermales bacterium]|nr:hypothetical protein [Rhodothermales bacterium]
MRLFSRIVSLGVCIFLVTAAAQPAHAQFGGLKKMAKKAAGDAVEKVAGDAVDRAADDAAQKASDAATEAIDDAILGSDSTGSVSSSGNMNAGGAGNAGAGMGVLGAMLGGGGGGGVETVDFRELQALLPDQLSGMNRTNAEGQKSAALGINMSTATATYESGDGSIDLTITDMGSMRAFAALGYAWASGEVEQESADGYMRTVKYKDFPAYEEFDKSGPTASFSVMIGQRFLVAAEGNGVSMAQVKAAVDRVDLAKLDAMKGEALEVTDFQKLKALLPNSAAGMGRTNASGQKSTTMGYTMSTATGQYGSGDKSMRVSITDLGSMQGIATLGYTWLNMQIESESDTGYEKTGKYGEYPSHEKFTKEGSQAEYSIVVNGRFMVAAEGSGITMDDAKAAVQSIDVSQLTPPEPAK